MQRHRGAEDAGIRRAAAGGNELLFRSGFKTALSSLPQFDPSDKIPLVDEIGEPRDEYVPSVPSRFEGMCRSY